MSKKKKKESDEMQDLIAAWSASDMNKSLVDRINQQREYFKSIIKADKQTKKSIIEALGKHQEHVRGLITDIFFMENMSPIEKVEYEFVADAIVVQSDKQTLMLDHIHVITTWYTYLFVFEYMEEYELCADLKRVIVLEQNTLRTNLFTFFPPFEDADENNILNIEAQIKKEIWS